jgi:pyruvate carboxylase
MKMFTTVTAPCNGTIQEILVAVGNTLESKDLMMKLVK